MWRHEPPRRQVAVFCKRPTWAGASLLKAELFGEAGTHGIPSAIMGRIGTGLDRALDLVSGTSARSAVPIGDDPKGFGARILGEPFTDLGGDRGEREKRQRH